jgi:hypothetical protein
MKLPYRIVVYPSDLAIWFGRGEEAAKRYHLEIKERLGLEEKIPLLVFHLRDLWKAKLRDLINALNLWMDPDEDVDGKN